MGKNKTGKYFKYAIGEIVLVVIGILIALQINNWNDAKKEKVELNEYLVKIKNDINQNALALDSIKNNRVEVNKNCQLLLQSFFEGNFDIEIYFNAAAALNDYYYVPNESGYNALKNSNYLGNINGTKLDSLIVRYDSQTKKLVKTEEGFFKFIETMEAHWNTQIDIKPLMKLYILGHKNAKAYLKTEEAKNEKFEEHIKEVFNEYSFVAIISRTAAQTQMLQDYKDIIKTGQEVIKEIEYYTDIK